MGLFEDTVVKAKDAFDVASKKTGEVISVQKLKIKISQLQSDIKKDYQKIGELYYQGIKNDTDIKSATEDIITSIDEKLHQIEETEIEISNQKDFIICSECGNKNPSGSGFCNGCGKKL